MCAATRCVALLCRFCIATYPGVQDALAAELDRKGLLASVSRPEPRNVELSDLPELHYLDAVRTVAIHWNAWANSASPSWPAINFHCSQMNNKLDFSLTCTWESNMAM